MPTLPITRKDGQDTVEGEEVLDDRRRRRYRSLTMDVRKLILLFAIMYVLFAHLGAPSWFYCCR
jgi:hypothetical protein